MIAPSKHGKTRRLLFACAVLLLWTLALLLLLETGAALHVLWTERHNPFILAAKGLGPKPVLAPLSPLPSVSPLCGQCSAQPGWRAFSIPPGSPDWENPAPQAPREEQERRRAHFAGLNEAQRNLYALLNDEYVLVLDNDARIRSVYGNWIARASFRTGNDFPLFQETAKQIQASHLLPMKTPQGYLQVSMPPMPGMEDSKEVLLLKGNEREPAYVFFPTQFRTLRFTQLPANTPWDGLPYFRYKKNLRNAYSGMGITFDTNNYGFRDHDVIVPKPAGTFRILCVGGSTTEEGATNNTTYPKRLEQALNTCFAGKKTIEVINCGVSGMTTSGHLARLADFLALQPDLILLYEGVNDIHRDLAEYWRGVDSTRMRSLFSHSRFARWKLNAALYPRDAEMREGIRGLCMENLRAFGMAARNQGIRTALCSVASPDPRRLSGKEQVFYDYCARTGGLDPCLSLDSYRRALDLLNQETAVLCRQEGFLYIPVAESMEEGYGCFADLYHMTDAGIERKAELIFECLNTFLQPVLQ